MDVRCVMLEWPTKGYKVRGERRGKKMNEQEMLDLEPLDRIIDEFGGKAGTLIPVLQRAQEIYSYLPPRC